MGVGLKQPATICYKRPVVIKYSKLRTIHLPLVLDN